MWRRSLQRTAALLAALSVLLPVSACGPLSNEDVRERYAVEAAAPAGDPVEAAPAPVADSAFENRIKNGSFEEKDETGRPRGWAVSPPAIMIAEGSPAVYPFDGDEYMMLRSVGDRYGILAFTLNLDASALGKTVVATAQGRAPLWRYMFLSVRYAVDGAYTENLHEWPACPHNWTENIAREHIPLDADPGSVQVRILVRDEPGYTFCVDDVRAFVLDGDA